MARGIDHTNIFVDDADRAKFLGIVEELVFKTGTKIPAWSIMDNHYHLLILSGPLGLPAFMRKLMTRTQSISTKDVIVRDISFKIATNQ